MAELKKAQEQTPARRRSIEDWLNTDRFKTSLATILPKHLTSERFAAVAMRQFRTTPGLLDCSPESVLSAFMEAASLGLEIGINGESYIIPWNNSVKDRDGNWQKTKVAQLQVGYLGHMKLGWNSGLLASIEGDVVTRDEASDGRFEYQRGTNGFLHHRASADRDLSEDNIAFAWGMVWVKGSDRPIWRVIDHEQIEKLRNTGQSANSPAWKNHYDEMALAKVLKRTLKWAPKSREQAQAIALDDQADAGVRQDFEGSDLISGIIQAESPKPLNPESGAVVRSANVSPTDTGSEKATQSRDSASSPAPPSPPVKKPEAPAPAQASSDQGGLGW